MKGHADHTGPGLAVETSAFVLLAEAWPWEIFALGVRTTAIQAPSDGAPVVSDLIRAAPRRPL